MDRVDEYLREREKDNLLRRLHPADSKKEGMIYFRGKGYFDFSSNDYLGLSGHPKLKNASIESIERFGTGSSASRLLSGDSTLHHILEKKTANFIGKEAALIYNSGYQANLGVISALRGEGDVIFSDRLSHASIIDGILLSRAKFFRFRHNDANHLESLLKKERNNFREALIVTETIFSMDGDRTPLREITDLKEKYDCRLLIDEAHATGVFGKNGGGIAEEEGLIGKVDIIMGTFGKALGSFGAYVAASEKMKNYLVNASRSFIYSTALPPSVIASNIAGLDLVREEPFRRIELLENSRFFRQGLIDKGFEVRGTSQIVPLILGDNAKAIAMSEELQKRLYWALPIRPPTVPKGEARLRFSLTYYHNRKILERLIDDICEISRGSTRGENNFQVC